MLLCAERQRGSVSVKPRSLLNESFLHIFTVGPSCGSNTSGLSTWLEESFGKFSIYVAYEDLRLLNGGFEGVRGPPRYTAAL